MFSKNSLSEPTRFAGISSTALGRSSDPRFVSKERNNNAGLILFNELLRHPRNVGTVCPSSRYLSGRMAAAIDIDADGFIVELGAGTGTITESLLRRGVPVDKLIVIERSAKLAQYLSRRFPRICVVHGDAADVPAVLRKTKSVHAVISGLPLRSLPSQLVSDISSGWVSALHGNGRVVQFTYAPFRSSAWLAAGLERYSAETVWANFPPARVEIFSPVRFKTSPYKSAS